MQKDKLSQFVRHFCEKEYICSV